MWQQLVIHLALISFLVLCTDFVLDRGEWLDRWARQLGVGVLMGGGGMLSMTLAEPLMPGFVFDLRAPLVACAALFGGLPGGLAAAALTAGMRMYIGGGGMAAGLATVVIALCVGLFFHRVLKGRVPGPWDVATFAAVVMICYPLAYPLVPAEVRLKVFEATVLPASTLNGAATAIVGLLLWRGQRQRSIARSDLIYRQMVHALPDCLNVKDLSHRFIAANPATAQLMGAACERDLIGRTDADFYPPEAARAFEREEDEMIAGGAPVQVEQLIPREAGEEIWVSTLKAPLYGPDGEMIGLITHCRDITEKHHVSRIKREFVSTVSHELRTPLTSIRGALGILSSGALGEVPDKAAGLLAIALSNSERLVLLINDILDMEKLESGKMSFDIRPQAVAPIVAAAVEGARAFQPERGVRLRVDDRSGGAMAAVDEGRLRQVIDNLLSNAIKFSPEGGTVDVAIAEGPGETLRVSVTDAGPGIDPDFADRVFAPFEQADGTDARKAGGTGLGLSICRMIVERLGGRIGFRAAPGGGTVFEVELDAHAPVVRAEPPERTPREGTVSVLYLEDDAALCEVVSAGIGEGIDVTPAGSLGAARRAMDERSYDVVVIDPDLPDGSGLDLLAELPDRTRAIVFSATEFSDPLPDRVDARLVKSRVSEAELGAAIARAAGIAA